MTTSTADASKSTAKTDAIVRALARRLNAELIETHISWVILGEATAYKIKKPLRFSFVNYSTLQSRRHFCHEEVRLNARLAPGLYLGVSSINGAVEAPAIDGAGEVLEYAVRMQRFPAGALFSERLAAGVLDNADIDEAALLLGGFHASAAIAGGPAEFGQPQHKTGLALTALEGARPATSDEPYTGLREWLEAQARALAPLWRRRRQSGKIRECHGDLHLANLVRLDKGVAAFDAIEFDATLRWIDVIDDIALPVMDLAANDRHTFAFRLLNRWLDITGEHEGLPSLRFACAYRALVRCQVELLRERRRAAAADRYFAAALAWTKNSPPRLYITHGLPGSGKTYESQLLLEREGAIRLRSDVERKRIFGLGMLEHSHARGMDLYTEEATALTYSRLLRMAEAILRAGFPVVIDAAFLRRSERTEAFALAAGLDIPCSVIDCDPPWAVLRRRLAQRSGDASEADVAVLQRLAATAEPLQPDELVRIIRPATV